MDGAYSPAHRGSFNPGPNTLAAHARRGAGSRYGRLERGDMEAHPWDSPVEWWADGDTETHLLSEWRYRDQEVMRAQIAAQVARVNRGDVEVGWQPESINELDLWDEEREAMLAQREKRRPIETAYQRRRKGNGNDT
jgi:hypothetical protein